MAFYPISPASPSPEPITTNEAKSHLRYHDDDEDTIIGTYVKAARAHVEAHTGVTYGSRAVTAYCDSFSDLAALPFTPVTAVTSIKYADAAGVQQTVPDTVYKLGGSKIPSITLKDGQSWPEAKAGERVELVATVGGSLPDDVRAAILLLLGHYFKNREAVGDGEELPFSDTALLANHRRYRF